MRSRRRLARIDSRRLATRVLLVVVDPNTLTGRIALALAESSRPLGIDELAEAARVSREKICDYVGRVDGVIHTARGYTLAPEVRIERGDPRTRRRKH